jgi:hypothetical protein
VLRGRLAFNGVVISDALEMAGAAPPRAASPAPGPGLASDLASNLASDLASDLEVRVERALAAGVDLLVFEDLEHGLRARAHLAKLAGLPPWRDRLASALARVESFRRGLARHAPAGDRPPALGLAASRCAQVQREAIALVGDPAGSLPLGRDHPLCFALPRALDPDRRLDSGWLRARLGERFPRSRVLEFDVGPAAPAELARGVGAGPETVVLGCLGRGDTEWIRGAARAVGDGQGARIGVALHRPAEILELPAGWTRLVSYGFGRIALGALVDVLAGVVEPRGRVLGLGQVPDRTHIP